MNKSISSFAVLMVLFMLPLFSRSQTVLVWEKSYGGSLFEQPFGSEPTPDGGIIMGGHSLSSDGDLSSNYGDYDWWVLQVNETGDIVWQKSYGGSLYDKCRYATRNPDGTYLAFGSVKSNDFDVSGNHSSGENDYWLLKLDAAGGIIWSKCYGGTQEEGGRSVIRAIDGNYLVAGYTHSSDADVTDHIGAYDVWLVKVREDNGNIIWAKSYGGTKVERVRSIAQWPNGDFVFTGNTESDNYDLTGTVNNGEEDVYVARIDSAGNHIWSVQYGGPGKDRAYYCTRDLDGNILVAGKDSANGGNVTNNKGESDCWVLKLDYNDGHLIWEKSFGGTLDDEGFRINPTADGGYIIGATTESDDGDSPGARGLSDYWLIKTDADLNIEWTRTDGGGSWDHLNDLVINNDGSYTAIGFSSSDVGPNSEVTGNHGSFDTWLVNITYCDSVASIIPSGSVSLCTGETLVLQAPLAESYLWSTGATTQNISISSAGNYTVQITRANGSCVRNSLVTSVSLLPAPQQPGVFLTNDTLVCSSSASGYQWFYNGTAINGETNNTLANADLCGFYYVQITDANGCKANSDSLFCPLTVNEFSADANSVSLFPNPAKELITLMSDMKLTSVVEVRVYDLPGKKIIQHEIKWNKGVNKTELNIKDLPAGTYFMELKNTNGLIARKRFVKN